VQSYLILLLSTLLATGKALFCKALGTGRYSKKETALLNFKALLVAFVCSLFFVIGDVDGLLRISGFSLILSLTFGASVAFTQVMQTKAMGSGPASIVTLIYSCGFLVPIFYGLAFWSERVSPWQWGGMLLLLVALWLIVCKREKRDASFAWLPFAVVAMLGSGTNAILQKTHQYSAFSDELRLFLVYSLFFSSLFTGVASLLMREARKSPQDEQAPRERLKKAVVPLCLGVCVGTLNFSNLYLSGRLPSVILFPIYNVGSMLLTVMISALIYRDQPTKRQRVGFLLGIIAILIVGML
jgi:drug/metabolite transporter (DMT)-like permease